MSLFLGSVARLRATQSSLGFLSKAIKGPAAISSFNVSCSTSTDDFNTPNLFEFPVKASNSSTVVSTEVEYIPDASNDITKKKLSRAALVYLEKAKQYDEMISEARAEYTTGMRHLANMMGENPESFTQADANVILLRLAFCSSAHFWFI